MADTDGIDKIADAGTDRPGWKNSRFPVGARRLIWFAIAIRTVPVADSVNDKADGKSDYGANEWDSEGSANRGWISCSRAGE